MTSPAVIEHQLDTWTAADRSRRLRDRRRAGGEAVAQLMHQDFRFTRFADRLRAEIGPVDKIREAVDVGTDTAMVPGFTHLLRSRDRGERDAKPSLLGEVSIVGGAIGRPPDDEHDHVHENAPDEQLLQCR